MVTRIDARGLSCPQPVILTDKALQKGEFPIEVVVDTVTSRENIQRIAQSMGYRVQFKEEGEDFKVMI